jgi:hypothetical protein
MPTIPIQEIIMPPKAHTEIIKDVQPSGGLAKSSALIKK